MRPLVLSLQMDGGRMLPAYGHTDLRLSCYPVTVLICSMWAAYCGLSGERWGTGLVHDYYKEGPEILAAVASLPETSEIAQESGLKWYWWATAPDEIGAPRQQAVADSVLGSVGSWIESQPDFDRLGYCGKLQDWIRSYRVLVSFLQIVAGEDLAIAIGLTPETQSAFRRSPVDIDRVPWMRSYLEPSELHKTFYAAATVLSGLPGAERLEVLSKICSNVARVLEAR